MFSTSNLKTFRLILPKSSLEKAEKRNTAEQKLLDRKIKFFESEQTLVQKELSEIRKEKYSRSFYKSAPHIEDQRLQHSRYLDVAVSTNKKDNIDINNNQEEPARHCKQNNTSSRAKKQEARPALISASGVVRTISSMKNASISNNFSCTPGQVVRVSIPVELEDKVKSKEDVDVKKYLSQRRHSVHLGSGIASKLMPAESLLNLSRQATGNGAAPPGNQFKRRMSVPARSLVDFQNLCRTKELCGDKQERYSDIAEEEEEEEEEFFIDDDIDMDNLYIKDEPDPPQYGEPCFEINSTENIPDDSSDSSSMIAEQCELPNLDCVSLSSRSNSLTESNDDEHSEVDLEELLNDQQDVFIDEESGDDETHCESDKDRNKDELSINEILRDIDTLDPYITKPESDIKPVKEDTPAPFLPQPPSKCTKKPTKFRKRSRSLSITVSRNHKTNSGDTSKSLTKTSPSFIHPSLAKRRGSYSNPPVTRTRSVSNDDSYDKTRTTEEKSKTPIGSSSQQNLARPPVVSQRGKTPVARRRSLDIGSSVINDKTVMTSRKEQVTNSSHPKVQRSKSYNDTFENIKPHPIPLKEAVISVRRPVSRTTSETCGTTSHREHCPSINSHRAVSRTKSSNDTCINTNEAIRSSDHSFLGKVLEDHPDVNEEVLLKNSCNQIPRKTTLYASLSTPCNVGRVRNRSNSIAGVHTMAFPLENFAPTATPTVIAAATSSSSESIFQEGSSKSLPFIAVSKNLSNDSEEDSTNQKEEKYNEESPSFINILSPRRITERQQHNDGRLSRPVSSVSAVSTIDLSAAEESVLRQAYLKRVEIQESAKRMVKLSSYHFGDSKVPVRTRRVQTIGRNDPDKSQPGIKVHDLSSTSRKWKRYVRKNSEEVEGVLNSVNNVTDCRYLRSSSIEETIK